MFNSWQEIVLFFCAGYGIWCFVRDGKTAIFGSPTTPSVVAE